MIYRFDSNYKPYPLYLIVDWEKGDVSAISVSVHLGVGKLAKSQQAYKIGVLRPATLGHVIAQVRTIVDETMLAVTFVETDMATAVIRQAQVQVVRLLKRYQRNDFRSRGYLTSREYKRLFALLKKGKFIDEVVYEMQGDGSRRRPFLRVLWHEAHACSWSTIDLRLERKARERRRGEHEYNTQSPQERPRQEGHPL